MPNIPDWMATVIVVLTLIFTLACAAAGTVFMLLEMVRNY